MFVALYINSVIKYGSRNNSMLESIAAIFFYKCRMK